MMVAYKCKDIESGTLRHLKDLRQAGSLCDVSFTVGQDEIVAHRCVLAVGSEYFKTLFMGQFMEASMQNIDLSEVTEDVKGLEQVVDFLYTGDININDGNIEVLVKLSSYLMIEPLKDLCTRYLLKTFKLKTCLHAYLLADKYSLKTIRDVCKMTLISRLRDCSHVILEDNLTLSPFQVAFLIDEVFHWHCTAADILYFLCKWLKDGMQEQWVGIRVANHILGNMDQNIKPAVSCTDVCLLELQKTKLVDLFYKIKEELVNNKSEDVEKFLKKSQQILMKTFPDDEIEKKIYPELQIRYNLRDGPNSSRKRKAYSYDKDSLDSNDKDSLELASSPPKKSKHFDNETVAVALVPRQCLVDALDKAIKDMDGSKTAVRGSTEEPVFTLCCYIPSTQTWYNIQDFDAKDPDTPLGMKFKETDTLKGVLFKEEFVLRRNQVGKRLDVYFYNLKEKTWRTIKLPEPSLNSEDHVFHFSNFCFVSCENHLYLLQKVLVFDFESYTWFGEYFVGYRLTKDGQRWKLKFRTEIERFSDPDSFSDEVSFRETDSSKTEMQASISPVSNELIFTHGPQGYDDGFNYVFIVNLNAKNPIPVNVFKEHSLEMERSINKISVIRTGSSFCIADQKSLQRDGNKAYALYEYKYNSLTLTESQNVIQNPIDSDEEDLEVSTGLRMSVFPCIEVVMHTNGESMWLFEGCRHCLKSPVLEYSVNESGAATSRKHTPSPFSVVTTVAVGEMAGHLLEQIAQGPVQPFLHSEMKQPLMRYL